MQSENQAPHRTRKDFVKSIIQLLLKLGLTVGAFYLLLTHKISDGHGSTTTTIQAIMDYLPNIDTSKFIPYLILAASIKAVGILSSMLRWHLLLKAQNVVFPFLYLVGTFLIGRFLGTFLPSTVGLDGYKLYDAARGSGKVVEPAMATIIEKVLGLCGIFVTYLVALPFGISLFAKHAALIIWVTVPMAVVIILSVFLLLYKTEFFTWLLFKLPLPQKIKNHEKLDRIITAAQAYQGQAKTIATLLFLSFLVHFLTASMYYFTALAISAVAPFWRVTLASTIQIFATVLSPFTIAGEGIREIVQALLLAKEMGVGASVLSAALGFYAAEALTLVGGIIWLLRKKPKTANQAVTQTTEQ